MTANKIAKWNAATSKWTAMGTGMNGNVSALAIDSLGIVYAGVAFITAGGVTACLAETRAVILGANGRWGVMFFMSLLGYS